MAVEVEPVRYQSHDDGYPLDVEVLDSDELRARVAKRADRGFERVDFQCLLFVRSGSYRDTVDFQTHQCGAGSCLSIRPGQVHRFGPQSDWHGWILIVSPHHVPEMVDALPTHVQTAPDLAETVAELFERLAADTAARAGPQRLLGELLALQTEVLVRRLALGQAAVAERSQIDPVMLERYRAYRQLVDQEYRRWHHVAAYAPQLGCSAKSLNRACRAASDVTAKRVIVERIVLEAKRLLAHSNETAARIGAELGFDEPTNFTKFFRRETDLTPAAFRTAVQGDDGPSRPSCQYQR